MSSFFSRGKLRIKYVLNKKKNYFKRLSVSMFRRILLKLRPVTLVFPSGLIFVSFLSTHVFFKSIKT